MNCMLLEETLAGMTEAKLSWQLAWRLILLQQLTLHRSPAASSSIKAGIKRQVGPVERPTLGVRWDRPVC